MNEKIRERRHRRDVITLVLLSVFCIFNLGGTKFENLGKGTVCNVKIALRALPFLYKLYKLLYAQ